MLYGGNRIIKKLLIDGFLLLIFMPSCSFTAAALGENVLALGEVGLKRDIGLDSAWEELIADVTYGRVKGVDRFLKKDIDIDRRDKLGQTLLSHALHVDGCKKLRRAKEASYSCESCLDGIFNKLVVFYTLLRYGADYSAIDRKGAIKQYLDSLRIPEESQLWVKDRAERLIAERIYRMSQVLFETGGMGKDVIIQCILPYLYDDIETHNNTLGTCIRIDYEKFFKRKVELLRNNRQTPKKCLISLSWFSYLEHDKVKLVEFVEEDSQVEGEYLKKTGRFSTLFSRKKAIQSFDAVIVPSFIANHEVLPETQKPRKKHLFAGYL